MQSFDDFCARHGQPVQLRQRYLFPDGAQSNGREHLDPPSDPRALISLQIEYLTAKLAEEEQKAQQARQPYVESESEFNRRQACSRVFRRDRWIYENGAIWTSHGGIEPPDDATSLLAIQSEFLAVRIEQEERLFRECREYIASQANYHRLGAGPAPAEQAFTDLERFQTNILQWREVLQAKRDELRNLRGPTPGERAEEQRRQFQTTAQACMSRVANFQI